jgi:hypothetical protein
MRQPNLRGLPAFADAPFDMPYAIVADFRNKGEAEVVRACIEFAKDTRGISQRQIARMCKWKRDSYLSEIASDGNAKTMPDAKLGLFALATGTNLLSQWREQQEADRRISGKTTAQDRTRIAVAAMREAARAAA